MKIVGSFVALILIWSLVSGSAMAGMAKGVEAYRKRDFGRAMKEFKADGSGEACYNIALMHYKGEGVKANRGEAVKWFRKAAEKGNMQSQFVMGTMYDKGEDLARDQGEAFRWYRKAAEQGHAQAQFNVGYMYTMGEGVKKDRGEALVWLKKAAAQRHEKAGKLLKVLEEGAQPAAKPTKTDKQPVNDAI
jgi:TPR repeat protein